MNGVRRFTIWSNATLPGSAELLLSDFTAAHELVVAARPSASNLVSGPGDTSIMDAEVVFGQPDPAAVVAAPKLRWVHLTSAGYTRYDDATLRAEMIARGIRLTTSSDVYAGPCAEHVVAMMLGLLRELPMSLDTQRTSREWPMTTRRHASRLLAGERVLFLGFGAIARRLCELLAPFGPVLTAFRRQVGASDPRSVAFVDAAGLGRELARADHVVDLLPESASTIAFVDDERLAAMKSGAYFYNVGRGTTVDQAALVRALERGQLGAAYLDVTTPEPLPRDHALWTAPRCYITPHTAGGHRDEADNLVRHFGRNLRAYEEGRPLANVVIGTDSVS